MDQGGVNQERRMALFEDAYDLWISKRLTQHNAALVLGVDVRTFRRWVGHHGEDGAAQFVRQDVPQWASRSMSRCPPPYTVRASQMRAPGSGSAAWCSTANA